MSSLADDSFVILGSSPTQSVDEVNLDSVASLSISSKVEKGERRRSIETSIAQAATKREPRSHSLIEHQALCISPGVNVGTNSTSAISAKDLMIWSRPNLETELTNSKSNESATQTDQGPELFKSLKREKESLKEQNGQKQVIGVVNGQVESVGGDMPQNEKEYKSKANTNSDKKIMDDKDLAASFILGEIGVDVLKVS